MIRLKYLSGPKAGGELATAVDTPIRIGTAPECEVVVTGEGVAAEQATLQKLKSGHYHLRLSGHSDAVRIQDVPLADFGGQLEFVLRRGDKFSVGQVDMKLSHGRPRLLLAGGESAGREIPLTDKPVSIGRSPANTLVLDDGRASSHHAHIRCLPTGFVIEDQGSKNGTFVNGRKISTHALADCDAIDIGMSQLYFLIDAPEESLPEVSHNLVLSDQEGDVFGHLTFIAGPHKGSQIPMGESPVTLGTHDACTFVVSDPDVSNLHISLTKMDTGNNDRFRLVVESSGSRVRVNAIPCVGETVLTAGDLLEFGDSVAELRLAGGVVTKHATVVSLMTSMIVDGSVVDSLINQMPKFVINGHIERAESITIGQSPMCTLRLEGEDVAPTHCTITYKDEFLVIDQSLTGTYLGGKRIVEAELQTGHVLQIGEHVLSVTVRPGYCALETVDTAAAMAAVQVARETQFNLADALPDLLNSSFGESGQAYKTVARMDVVDVDDMASLVRERKAELNKRVAPAWRPSSDITGNPLTKVAFIAVTIAALLLAVAMHTKLSDAALVNQPLSESHSSQAFVDAVDQLDVVNACQACHSLGNGVPDKKCAGCHQDFAGQLRAGHAQEMTASGQTCANCHTEHRGHKRSTGDQHSSALGALDRCSQCHDRQHEQDFQRKGPVTVEAGLVDSFIDSRQDLQQLHVLHSKLTDNDGTGIGCAGCHSALAKGGDVAGVQPAPAGLSCFRCHEGGEQFLETGCESCHRGEHQGAVLERSPSADDGGGVAIAVPSTGKSFLIAFGLALLVFLPLLGIGALRWRFRARIRDKMLEKLQAFPVELAKRLVHSINIEKCVGCQMCVKACPTNVLELVNHKAVIVNFDACIQCKRCEDACAFDALRMHEADKPPPMVTMPQVDANYMTPVDGMYLIGQAAGTPQIKNAANLGHAVVQHMLRRGLRPGSGAALGAEVDVIIVGSGPAGLSTAVTCIDEGLSYLCLEKQRDYAWTIRNYYHKGKPVMAEPNNVELVSKLPHFDGNREQLLEAWEQTLAEKRLDIRAGHNVTNVQRVGDIFQVTAADSKDRVIGTYTGTRVVLAIGTMGNPRRLGCPGDDLEKVKNALVDPDEFRSLDILVVGGTDSCIEVALALCEHNRVSLSCRSANFLRCKPKNLELIEKAFKDGKVKPLFATVVKEVTETHVTIEYKSDQSQEQLINQQVFAMIGGVPPVKWLQSLGVPYVDKPHSWSPPRTDKLARRHQKKRS